VAVGSASTEPDPAAAPTIGWGGVTILALVHLMKFTWGNLHPDYSHSDVHHNVVTGFRLWPLSLAYRAAIGVLALHLSQGLWSSLQTLGFMTTPPARPPRATCLTGEGHRRLRRIQIQLSLLAVMNHIPMTEHTRRPNRRPHVASTTVTNVAARARRARLTNDAWPG